MYKTIFGIFEKRQDVEEAINALESQGFNPKDISIVMKDKGQAQEVEKNTGADVAGGALSGAATGAVVGGIAGLLAGTVVPALGGFLIGGPIGAALGLTGAAATTVSGAATGVVAGGLIGGLMGIGVSQSDAKRYEQRVKEGAILLAVPATDEEETYVIELFQKFHASDVRSVAQDRGVQEMNTQHSYADRVEPDVYEATHSHVQSFATVGAKGGKARQSEGKKKSSQKKAKGKKGGASTHAAGDEAMVKPIQVKKYLKNLDYPCSKADLINNAEREGANKQVIQTLSDMPGKNFHSSKEVSEAIGKIE